MKMHNSSWEINNLLQRALRIDNKEISKLIYRLDDILSSEDTKKEELIELSLEVLEVALVGDYEDKIEAAYDKGYEAGEEDGRSFAKRH